MSYSFVSNELHHTNGFIYRLILMRLYGMSGKRIAKAIGAYSHSCRKWLYWWNSTLNSNEWHNQTSVGYFYWG